MEVNMKSNCMDPKVETHLAGPRLVHWLIIAH